MLSDNLSQAVNKVPQVFWSGEKLAETSARQFANSIGGRTLEMTKLGQHLEKIKAPIDMWYTASANFANVASNSACEIYSIQNAAGVKITSAWATIEYPLLAMRNIIYGVATTDTIHFMLGE